MARICSVCGKPVTAGMTNADGDFYVHEECFEKYMDETYGKHRWMEILDDGYDGYYIYADDAIVGGCCGTGIFYTEWEEGENE